MLSGTGDSDVVVSSVCGLLLGIRDMVDFSAAEQKSVDVKCTVKSQWALMDID